MKKVNPDWLLGLNIVIAFSCIGFLRVWDTFGFIERRSLAQIGAITWGVRIAGLSIIAIGLTCLIWEVMISRREGRRKSVPPVGSPSHRTILSGYGPDLRPCEGR